MYRIQRMHKNNVHLIFQAKKITLFDPIDLIVQLNMAISQLSVASVKTIIFSISHLMVMQIALLEQSNQFLNNDNNVIAHNRKIITYIVSERVA